MTKIIGLTGGIGSGKSTIAGFFKDFGVPVYIADDEAKKIMQSNKVIRNIREVFGSSIFENDVLVRSRLAEIVFNDENKLAKLNEIIHPAVKNDFELWLLKRKDFDYVLYEAAILFESGRYKDCDVIITVTAPEKIRIERVIQRDQTTRQQVLNRIKMQWNDEKRIAKSDFIINNEDIKLAKLEVLKILKILNIKQNQS